MSGYTEPNYTQTPNDFFDVHMREMGEAELRVTLAVIRKTMGFHKKSDAISWSQIMDMTGLSRTSTQDGIDKAIEHGFIEIVGQGKRGVNIFSLVVKPNQSTNTTSTGSVALPVISSVALPTKEKKERKEKSARSAEKQRKPNPIFDTVCEVIFGIDPKTVSKEGGRIGPIAAWLNGQSEGMKRNGGQVGFISRAAEPDHVKRFASWYKSANPNNSMPLDFVKFVEAWRKWATAAGKSTVSVKPAVIMDFKEPTASERAELEAARKSVRPEWESEAVS